MTIGSLFSGVGGLELGLERAGLGPVAWQAESDPWCRRVLAKHWPEATRYEDVRDVDHSAERVELICGGFPCQDLSDASRGRGRGIDGPRSGLWRELLRVVHVLRPRWVVVENVAGAAARRWVPVLRVQLHAAGYACLPVVVSAAAVGAPFTGDRVFLAAADREGEPAGAVDAKVAELSPPAGSLRQDWGSPSARALGAPDGLPGGLDGRRVRALGNAVVPQVAEVIGRAIMEAS